MSTLERNVMASVRMIYAARMLTSMPALKLYIWAATLFVVAKMVWVAHVIENMQKVGMRNMFEFSIVAISHTQILVQLAVLVGAVAFISLFVDVVRSIRTPSFA